MDGGLLDTTIFHGAHLGTHHSCTHASALKPPSPAAHGHVEILRVACAFIVRHEFASRRCDWSASCVCIPTFASYTLARYVRHCASVVYFDAGLSCARSAFDAWAMTRKEQRSCALRCSRNAPSQLCSFSAKASLLDVALGPSSSSSSPGARAASVRAV